MMFSHSYRYFFIILLAVYSFLNTLSVEIFEYYPIKIPYSIILLIFLIVIFFVWEGNRILEKIFPLKNPSQIIKQYLLTHFVGSLVFTLVITVLVGLGFFYFFTQLKDVPKLLSIKLLLLFAFRINLFLNVLNIIFVYISKLEKANLETEKLKKSTAQAHLQAIKNQINPHFLFNNLNVLSALIVKEPATSIEFVRQFAKVYRYVLRSHEKEIIELNKEIDFADSYYFLLKKRFGEGLNININIDKKSRNKYIVPMALQMLIENAIKHNVVSQSHPLTIDIFNNDAQKLCIQNNLQIRQVDVSESTQIGLRNISLRYAYINEEKIIVEKNNSYFSVQIPLIEFEPKSEGNLIQKTKEAIYEDYENFNS
jgi:two-component system, LytTR family, sensor kinase